MRERQVIDRRHFHIRSYFSYHPISYGENGSEGPSILDKFRGDQSPIFVSRVLKSDSKNEICRCTFFLSDTDSVLIPLPPTQLYIVLHSDWHELSHSEKDSQKNGQERNTVEWREWREIGNNFFSSIFSLKLLLHGVLINNVLQLVLRVPVQIIRVCDDDFWQ